MEAILQVQPDLELGMLVEFDELFALRERLRPLADVVRARLYQAGLQEELQVELFEQELELRGPGENPLLIRLDPFRLEITGCPASLKIGPLAALLLDEAGVFRIASAELSFHTYLTAGAGRPLALIEPAFDALPVAGPLLDRRFSLTWEWGTSTTGYSLIATSTEDRELYAGFKVQDAYLTLPDLQSSAWFAAQQRVYETTLEGLLARLGWSV
ncbi:MAG TPA: hypothetical protein VK191_12515 [Symbiobacteriaceae bacterium]|nr:hypothetical protein [Symbiobacteriaceae bacterium]